MVITDSRGRLVPVAREPDLAQKVQVILEATRLAPELAWTWARMCVALVNDKLAEQLYDYDIEDVQSIIFRFYPAKRPKILTAICGAASEKCSKRLSVKATLELLAELAAEEGEYEIYGAVVKKMYHIASDTTEHRAPYFL